VKEKKRIWEVGGGTAPHLMGLKLPCDEDAVVLKGHWRPMALLLAHCTVEQQQVHRRLYCRVSLLHLHDAEDDEGREKRQQ
jgi:hypothetical protein